MPASMYVLTNAMFLIEDDCLPDKSGALYIPLVQNNKHYADIHGSAKNLVQCALMSVTWCYHEEQMAQAIKPEQFYFFLKSSSLSYFMWCKVEVNSHEVRSER